MKVLLHEGMSTEQVESSRAVVRAIPQIDGDTVRDGAIVYGNFTAYGRTR